MTASKRKGSILMLATTQQLPQLSDLTKMVVAYFGLRTNLPPKSQYDARRASADVVVEKMRKGAFPIQAVRRTPMGAWEVSLSDMRQLVERQFTREHCKTDRKTRIEDQALVAKMVVDTDGAAQLLLCGRSSIIHWRKNNGFPRPLLSDGANSWAVADIQSWLSAQSGRAIELPLICRRDVASMIQHETRLRIKELIADYGFPDEVMTASVGGRRSRWNRPDVIAWLESRNALRSTKEGM